MKINSKTYRLFATFTALLILLSIGMPNGLHAGHMLSGHCAADMEEQAMPVPMQMDCHYDTGLACACTVDMPDTQTQATPNGNKDLFKILPVLTESAPLALRLIEQNGFNPAESLRDHAVPLFLKNSSFLN